MKKIHQFTLSFLVLALPLLLASCGSDEGQPDVVGDEPVPIVLSAGVPATKAVVNTGDVFSAGIAGWETDAAAPDYAATADWLEAVQITAGTTAQPVVLDPPQYYHADRDVKTYIRAWHPAGTLAGGKVTFANADGTVDALLAAGVSGSKYDAAAKQLRFEHPTTQLKFRVVAGEGLDAGTQLRSITLKGVELPTGFDLATDAVTYAAAADLAVPGIDGTQVIGATATAAGQPVMVRPVAGNRVTLDVSTSTADFPGVVATIDGDADFVPGKAYTVTLTFRQSEVALTATVAPWEAGTGSGGIE